MPLWPAQIGLRVCAFSKKKKKRFGCTRVKATIAKERALGESILKRRPFVEGRRLFSEESLFPMLNDHPVALLFKLKAFFFNLKSRKVKCHFKYVKFKEIQTFKIVNFPIFFLNVKLWAKESQALECVWKKKNKKTSEKFREITKKSRTALGSSKRWNGRVIQYKSSQLQRCALLKWQFADTLFKEFFEEFESLSVLRTKVESASGMIGKRQRLMIKSLTLVILVELLRDSTLETDENQEKMGNIEG